jgi:hypothetical protein
MVNLVTEVKLRHDNHNDCFLSCSHRTRIEWAGTLASRQVSNGGEPPPERPDRHVGNRVSALYLLQFPPDLGC